MVHGHDESVKISVARFLERLDLKPIILHEQASGGSTIIEKIENNTEVGFGIVLYTPCDLGKAKNDDELQMRARQNVVFEHGYLIARLGRSNVCALVKDNIEKPNDISGVVYVNYDSGNGWHMALFKELKNA
ncbi:nucleotide-binding protein [Bacillus cereus]